MKNIILSCIGLLALMLGGISCSKDAPYVDGEVFVFNSASRALNIKVDNASAEPQLVELMVSRNLMANTTMYVEVAFIESGSSAIEGVDFEYIDQVKFDKNSSSSITYIKIFPDKIDKEKTIKLKLIYQSDRCPEGSRPSDTAIITLMP